LRYRVIFASRYTKLAQNPGEYDGDKQIDDQADESSVERELRAKEGKGVYRGLEVQCHDAECADDHAAEPADQHAPAVEPVGVKAEIDGWKCLQNPDGAEQLKVDRKRRG